MAEDGFPLGLDDTEAGHANGTCSYEELVRNHFYEYAALIMFLEDVIGMNGEAARRAAIELIAETGITGTILNAYESFAMGIAYLGARNTPVGPSIRRQGEQAWEDAVEAWDGVKDALRAWRDDIVDKFENCGLLYASAAVFIDVGGIELALFGLSGAALRVIRSFAWNIRLIGAANAVTHVAVSASRRGMAAARRYSVEAIEARFGRRTTSGTTEPDPDARPEPEGSAPNRRTRDERMEDIRALLHDGDLELAASNATSLEAMEARMRVMDAYSDVHDGFDVSNARGEIDEPGGMDLRQPIRIVEFPPPNQLVQWRNPTLSDTGDFFDPTGTSTPSQLGISQIGRTREVYNVRGEGLALSGRGTPNYRDTWTVKGRSEVTEGGTEQWIINEDDRPRIGDRASSGPTWRERPENEHWVEQEDGSLVSDEGRLIPDYVQDREDPNRTLTFWRFEPS